MMARRLRHTPLLVYLEPRQLEMLRTLAASREEPMTHLVRESVERYLVDEAGDADPVLGLVGMLDSGQSDTAREHDRVLSEHQFSASAPGGLKGERGPRSRRGT